MDSITGGNGNDTINGVLSATAGNTTLGGLDVINGGAGTVDTLAIVDESGAQAVPGTLQLSNVETVNVRSAGAATIDLTGAGISGVTTLNATQSVAATLIAAATTNVNVSGSTGAIIVKGGNNVTVTDSAADQNIHVGLGGDADPAGNISVTDTKQGTGNIDIEGGVNHTIVASGRNSGTIDAGTDGTTSMPSGTINITATGAAYAAATPLTLGAISTEGGATVSITQSATSDSSKALTDGAAASRTQSAVNVTASTATTAVTVVQDTAVAPVNAVTAVAGKSATQEITFQGVASGKIVTVTFDAGDTISFTAATALTAAQVASAFANLVEGAVQGSAASSLGSYAYGGAMDQGWTSGAVVSVDSSNAKVTFSNAAASPTALVAADDDGTSTITNGAVVAGVVAVTAKDGVMGVVGGAVTINDPTTGTDALTTVTLAGYGAGSSVDSNALTTLNLSNSNEDFTVTTTSTGSVTANLRAVGTAADAAALSIATVTGLTLNATTASVVDVTADAVTALTINATGDLDLSGSSFNAAKTITVSGAGAVTLDEDGGYTAVTAINASGSTGGVDASAQTLGTAATFTGGSGNDVVKLGATTKAQTLGAGDDVAVLTAALAAGGSIDGGANTDTLKTTTTIADGYDAAAQTVITGFERLYLSNAYTGGTADTQETLTLDLANLGLTSYVTTSGTLIDGSNRAGESDILVLNKLAANATVVLTADGYITATLADATGTSDVINVAMSSDGATTGGNFTAAGVETVNISVTDELVDANDDGKDDTNAADTLTLTAANAKTLSLSGSADLTLTLTGSTAVTTINASTLTGGLTVTSLNTTAATTITGGAGDDVFVGAADNDLLIGGAGNDKLTAVGELTTLTGGAGNDTFVLNTADTVNGYATITDLSAGDIIDTDAATFSSAKVTLADTAVFQDYANAAVNAVAADGAIWFQYSGSTYLVVDSVAANSTSFTNGSDQIIKIVGLVDLSTAVFNVTTGDLAIA